MKKRKSLVGVTLLEIMLVLAIASMIIVMSIRYYQNATISNNTNTIMEQIQNVTAAGDNLAQGGTGYSAVTQEAVSAVAGSNNLTTPYGTQITISGNPTATSYDVKVADIPAAVCVALSAKLTANTKFTSLTCSSKTGIGDLTYTYDSTK